MTEEAISRSEAKGTLTYGLDPVGNRQSLASTVTGISQQSASYNVNDQVLANTYDSNGNTLGANGRSYAYDSMDRMTSFNNGAVKMVYDGDGNRVAKTVGGVTTQYLVDELNPTGLPQVMDEVVKSGVVQRSYLYGLRRISQTSQTISYYGYDAHGDVRYLMNNGGAVTDTYDYDAFGNIVGSTGTTPNVYRYQGEALDSETGLYYIRARYYDPTVGRFLNVDPMTDEGEHPYEYTDADPVNGHDPTGEQDVIDSTMLMAAFMPPMPQLTGIKLSVKCIATMTLSVLSIPGQWMHAVTACQATPVGGGTGSGRGHGPASRPTKPPDCQHCFDTHAFAQKIDSLTAGNTFSTQGYPGHKVKGTYCAWYVHAALVAGGANVPSGNAFTFAASLPGSGFEQIASYPAPIRSVAGIPGSQQGDITVFGTTATHQYGHIEGFDGVNWTSYWQQGSWYPYGINADKKGPAGPAVVFRSKCPCGH
jgi:RHS repeat-associated protein